MVVVVQLLFFRFLVFNVNAKWNKFACLCTYNIIYLYGKWLSTKLMVWGGRGSTKNWGTERNSHREEVGKKATARTSILQKAQNNFKKRTSFIMLLCMWIVAYKWNLCMHEFRWNKLSCARAVETRTKQTYERANARESERPTQRKKEIV